MTRLGVVSMFAAATAIVLLAAACSNAADSPLAAEVYFTRVSTLTTAFDTANAKPSPSATTRESALRDLAAGLDDLRPPSAAKDAQHDLTVATRNLADTAHRFATSATVTPGESDIFVNDWERACHLLQDVALAKSIDVDLRCATALHHGAGG